MRNPGFHPRILFRTAATRQRRPRHKAAGWVTLHEGLDLSGPQFPHLQDEADNQVFPDSLQAMVSRRSHRGWQGSRERRLGCPPCDVHETGAAAVRLAHLSFAEAPSW